MLVRGARACVQVAVFGVPDEQWGQKVCVAYVGRPGPEVEEAMRAAAAARLAPYKRPKEYFATATCPTRPPGSCCAGRFPRIWAWPS